MFPEIANGGIGQPVGFPLAEPLTR